MQENDNYYTYDKLKCPDNVRIAIKEKYPEKLMARVVISSRGTSKPFFCALTYVIPVRIWLLN